MKKNKIQRELDKIDIPKELHSRAALGIAQAKAELNGTSEEKRIGMGKKKMTIGKKIMYTGTAAVAAFGIFVGSAFVSPAMAEVASKVPYLKNIFESKSINEVIWEALEDKGYKLRTMGGVPSSDRNLEIFIEGSDQYVSEVQEDIKTIVSGIIKDRDYDPHNIVVKKYQEVGKRSLSNEVQERQKKVQDFLPVTKEMEQTLKNQNFEILGSFGEPTDKELHIAIPKTEESKIDDIKKAANEFLTAEGFGAFSIKIDVIDQEKNKVTSDRSALFSVIHEGLTSKKEFKVKEIREYNYENRLDITTTVESTDNDAKIIANKIQQMIDELLTSEEAKAKLHGKPLVIEIYGKDNKKIN